MLESENIVKVLNPEPNIIQVLPGYNSNFPTFSIVTVGTQGPQGPAGSGTSTFTADAATSITAGQVVVNTTSGITPADPTNVEHSTLLLGIALNSGSMGQNIEVLTEGQVNGLSSLIAIDEYFVGLDGNLSLNPIADGATWMKSLGNAISAGSLILTQGSSIQLS